jgi:transmembrane sensor
MPEDRLQYLLDKFQAGTCTAAELVELENWYKQLAATDQPFVEEGTESAATIKDDMLLQFRRRLHHHDKQVVPLPRRRLSWRIAAAAAVLLIIGASIIYMVRSGAAKEDNVVKNNTPAVHLDVLPGGNHATLTLADGSSILLDTAKHGGLAQQGISAIHKPVDGLLVYEERPLRFARGSARDDVSPGMNTIRTPRGGQYQVRLPDGSKVWLNAASSIEFPVSFAGNVRKVKITGEVYFEVAHLDNKPFIVDVNGKSDVEVLGTHFNINAYDDETDIKTTLLKGSVKVSVASGQWSVLKPGEQAVITHHSPLTTHEADTEEAVAWKNGLFKFNDADIRSILRQAARWYDIEVEIKGNDSGERFRGKIARDVKLSEFLRILEVNQVSFQTQGKKIIIQL